MKYITLSIGLLVVGCGKESEESTNRMEGPIGDALRWKVGKEGFTKESLAEIKSANLSRIIVPKDITDLSPLESLPNLQTLDLRRQQKINDFSPLSKLKELQEQMKNLKFLSIANTPHIGNDNKITNLEPLLGLKKLDEVLIMNLAGLSDEEVSKLEEALPGCTIRR